MDGVGAEVDGTARAEKVVQADTSLGGKVPHAGIGVEAIVGDGIGTPAKGWIFMIRPYNAARSLHPGGDAMRADEVPAQDDGRDGGSGEGSADRVRGATGDTSRVGRRDAHFALEAGRVGLPEGEDFDGVLEVAVERAGKEVPGKDFAGVDACHDELEGVAIFREAGASLRENADLEWEMGRVGMEGSRAEVGGRCLRSSETSA